MKSNLFLFKYYGDEDEAPDTDNHNDRSTSRFSSRPRSESSSLKRIGKRDSSNETSPSDNEDEQRTSTKRNSIYETYSRRDSLASKKSARPKSIDSDRRSPSPARSTRSRRDSVQSSRSRRSTSLKSNRSPTPYRPKSTNIMTENRFFPSNFGLCFQGLHRDRIKV